MIARLSLIAALAAACGGSGSAKKEAESPSSPASGAGVRFGRFTVVPPEGYAVVQTDARVAVLRRGNATLLVKDSELAASAATDPAACDAYVRGAAEGLVAELTEHKAAATIDQQLGPR